ncbi:MAG: hypothetical protein ACK5IC_00365 [Moheibacter sp.]
MKNKVYRKRIIFPFVLLIGLILFGFQSTHKKGTLVAKQNSVTQSGIWLDLVTPNLEESKTFYQSLFGWTFTESNNNGLKNSLIHHEGKTIGSILEVPKSEVSVWILSVQLDDADFEKKPKNLVKKGAKKAIGTIEIPERGKQIIFEGEQGEEFSLVTGNPYVGSQTKADGSWMGAELWASDVERAKSFYENAFEVQTSQVSFDEKPYWFFEQDGKKLAGMIQNPITNQGTQWIPYIHFSDVKSLALQVEKSNGKVLAAPDLNLRNGQLAIIQDPNGAIFCVQSSK